MTCSVCGGEIRSNSLGICKRNPECKRANKAASARKYRRTHPEKHLACIRRYNAANPLHVTLSAAKKRAKKRGVPFDLTVEDLPAQPDNCPHCGIELRNHVGQGTGPRLDSPSLDRDVPSLGYVIGNVSWLCFGCNDTKNNRTMAEWLAS